MIVSGDPVKSEVLAALPGQKLFDKVVDGDLSWTARSRSPKSVADKRPLPRVRDLKVRIPNADAYFQFARNTVEGDGAELPGAADASTPSRPRSPSRSTKAWRSSASSSSR